VIQIVTVMKSGGDYTYKHVDRLKDMLADKAGISFNFLCLSDVPGPDVVPLRDGLPGWWSKMEVFKLPGPCIYFDLDTIICGSLHKAADLAKRVPFAILRDAYRGKSDPTAMQSSVMMWCGDMSHLYSAFISDPIRHMQIKGGDQAFIETQISKTTYIQDELPGQFISYKVDVRGKHVPDNARVIFFHGHPRPWEQTDIPYV